MIEKVHAGGVDCYLETDEITPRKIQITNRGVWINGIKINGVADKKIETYTDGTAQMTRMTLTIVVPMGEATWEAKEERGT